MSFVVTWLIVSEGCDYEFSALSLSFADAFCGIYKTFEYVSFFRPWFVFHEMVQKNPKLLNPKSLSRWKWCIFSLMISASLRLEPRLLVHISLSAIYWRHVRLLKKTLQGKVDFSTCKKWLQNHRNRIFLWSV